MIEQQLCFVDFVGNPRSKLCDNICFANLFEPSTNRQIDIRHLPLSCGVQSNYNCSFIDIVCLFAYLQHLGWKIRFFFSSRELKAGKGNAGERMERDYSIPFMSFFK
jgi:hypothetical protein